MRKMSKDTAIYNLGKLYNKYLSCKTQIESKKCYIAYNKAKHFALKMKAITYVQYANMP